MSLINSIDTPALVIHEAVALANISAFQQHCNTVGLALRPHIKTHKSVHFTQAQMAAGAAGITCQKIGEAEVMANAGISDILITFNIIGAGKLARLLALAGNMDKLSVTADNAAVVEGLSDTFKDHDKPLLVLAECDTGAGRCGVQTPQAAVELARLIDTKPGLAFGGLMTYPAPGDSLKAAEFMQVARDDLATSGIRCATVSTGGTPDMWEARTHSVFTEYRIGTYIYNDRSLLERGTCSVEDCAARVHATIISTPAAGRAVIDAGSKVLTSDLLGLSGYGRVVGHPDIEIVNLSEEHGVLSVPAECPLQVGDRIEIIPNHVCVVSNMFDAVQMISQTGDLQVLRIDARGRVR